MVRLSVNWQVTFISRQVWQSRHFHQTDSFKLWQTWETRMNAGQAPGGNRTSSFLDYRLIDTWNSLDYGTTGQFLSWCRLEIVLITGEQKQFLREVPFHWHQAHRSSLPCCALCLHTTYYRRYLWSILLCLFRLQTCHNIRYSIIRYWSSIPGSDILNRGHHLLRF